MLLAIEPIIEGDSLYISAPFGNLIYSYPCFVTNITENHIEVQLCRSLWFASYINSSSSSENKQTNIRIPVKDKILFSRETGFIILSEKSEAPIGNRKWRLSRQQTDYPTSPHHKDFYINNVPQGLEDALWELENLSGLPPRYEREDLNVFLSSCSFTHHIEESSLRITFPSFIDCQLPSKYQSPWSVPRCPEGRSRVLRFFLTDRMANHIATFRWLSRFNPLIFQKVLGTKCLRLIKEYHKCLYGSSNIDCALLPLSSEEVPLYKNIFSFLDLKEDKDWEFKEGLLAVSLRSLAV